MGIRKQIGINSGRNDDEKYLKKELMVSESVRRKCQKTKEIIKEFYCEKKNKGLLDTRII